MSAFPCTGLCVPFRDQACKAVTHTVAQHGCSRASDGRGKSDASIVDATSWRC
jgi:hypothetical protein